MLTIEDAKAAHGPSRWTEEIPEWGGDVLCKRLLRDDYITLSDLATDGTRASNHEYLKVVVKLSLINGDGSPFITDDSIYLLDENPILVTRLGKELIKRNGMLRSDAKKNSETTPTDSPSDSA